MSAFTLILDGKPTGKGRPRLGKDGHVYTPNATKLAEARVISAWQDAGSPRIDGPVSIELCIEPARPKSHYTTKGELSATGRRLPLPSGTKPDLDNALKLVMDALNKRAYRDDVNVVEVTVWRQWSEDGWDRTTVNVSGLVAT